MIINSLLDTDFYKFTISQYAWHFHKDTIATFSLIKRSKDLNLINIDLDDWNKEMKHLKSLRFSEEEISYLRSLNIFQEEFLNDLKNFSLNEILVHDKSHIIAWSKGYWWKSTLAETFVLSIVNELYLKSFKKYFNSNIFIAHERSCIENISYYHEILNRIDNKVITDFGTRRRASFDVQKYVNSYMINESYYKGTSNVFLSRMYGTDPIGTYAHEIPMIIASHYINEDQNTIFLKQREILDNWSKLYPNQFLIVLPDTFGYKNFFEDIFTESLAQKWNGVRHDSGDPHQFADYVINFYESLNINPKEKYIVFSDGLEISDIILLNRKYKNKINILFGWGTNLTNKGTIKPLSIVFKPEEIEISNKSKEEFVRKTVKLSDEPEKISPSPKIYPRLIETYKKLFKYDIYNK